MKKRTMTTVLTGVLASAPVVSIPSTGRAVVEPVVLSSSDPLPAPRWMFGLGEMPKAAGVAGQLALVKRAQLEGDFKSCMNQAKAARAKAKSLQSWLVQVELDCASKLESSNANSTLIHHSLEAADKKPEWFLKGPQASLLRQSYIKAAFVTLASDTKTERARAWNTIDRLQELSSYMDDKLRAKLWRSAGELAFVQQKTDAARDFFKRSLAEAESEETRSRLNALESALQTSSAQGASTSKNGATSKLPEAAASNASLEASAEELELVDRATAALKSGDLLTAVTDAVKIVQDYPGSARAKWATDRIFEAYVSLADRSDPKLQILRDQMMKQIEKVDSDRLAEWARLLYNRGQWQDSLSLARKSLETMTGARSTKVLELAGDAAVASEKYDIAREIFSTLISKHSGTPSAREALFRSGLLHYRMGNHAQAVADLERLLAFPQMENLELGARYWLWRSLQKMKSERASAVADDLMKKFPFSYYGLRARLERNGNVLEWKEDPTAQKQKIESRLWLTRNEKLAWEKVQLMLKAGWLDEAQAELRELPAPMKAEDKAVRALLWAAAAQYGNASKLANEAWDEKSELRRSPFTRSVFPSEFQAPIATNASARKIDRYLVQGLIKQESAYNVRASSTANAYGLMQLVPPTAKEVAADLKLGALQLPDDLFVPQKNIQMGTYYLSRLISKYQGNVPLALAAYNAGPGRIDRWLRARPSMKSVAATRSSSPDDEIWFDEIPFSETSFYVKAILRNILLYRVLDQGRVEVPNPVWSFDSGS